METKFTLVYELDENSVETVCSRIALAMEDVTESLISVLSENTVSALKETVNKSSQTIKTEYTKLSNNLQNIGNEAFGNTFSDLLSGETDKIGDHVICPAVHHAHSRAYGGTLVATSANR